MQIPPRNSTKWVQPDREHEKQFKPLGTPHEFTIELYSAIQALDQNPYLPEHHLNAFGHEVVAKQLAAEILARGLLKK